MTPGVLKSLYDFGVDNRTTAAEYAGRLTADEQPSFYLSERRVGQSDESVLRHGEPRGETVSRSPRVLPTFIRGT